MTESQNSSIADASIKIVTILTPLDSDGRHRAIKAAMILVGETPLTSTQPSDNDKKIDDNTSNINSKAQLWMQQNQLTITELEQVFHLEGDKAEIIATTIPGNSQKEKALNAYVLQGISQLLSNGDTSFDDKTARNLCSNHGCYDQTNHALYMKGKGNELAGSKESGWKLTMPGLKKGAILVKEISQKQ